MPQIDIKRIVLTQFIKIVQGKYAGNKKIAGGRFELPTYGL